MCKPSEAPETEWQRGWLRPPPPANSITALGLGTTLAALRGSVPRLSVLGHVPLTLTASAPGPSCLLLTQLPRHSHQLLLFSARSLPGLAPQLQLHHLPVLGLLFLHTMPRGGPFLQEAEHLGARLVFLQDPLGCQAGFSWSLPLSTIISKVFETACSFPLGTLGPPAGVHARFGSPL